MGAERSASSVSRKSIAVNLHPVRFSCGQLFGMAAGEDGENQETFRKLRSMPTKSIVHGYVWRGRGGGAELSKLPSEFIF